MAVTEMSSDPVSQKRVCETVLNELQVIRENFKFLIMNFSTVFVDFSSSL